MALAHRRPVYGRPARGLLTQGSDRRYGVIFRGCGQTRRRSMDGESMTAATGSRGKILGTAPSMEPRMRAGADLTEASSVLREVQRRASAQPSQGSRLLTRLRAREPAANACTGAGNRPWWSRPGKSALRRPNRSPRWRLHHGPTRPARHRRLITMGDGTVGTDRRQTLKT
jgi:hypothetical protein